MTVVQGRVHLGIVRGGRAINAGTQLGYKMAPGVLDAGVLTHQRDFCAGRPRRMSYVYYRNPSAMI
jgi:hypothetical protein